MTKVKIQFALGIKEGWSLFWSPVTGMTEKSKQVIFAERGAPGVKNQFVAGLRDGWTVFFSPFAGAGKAIKAALSSK
jgi:hypothetical protein